MRGVKPPRRKRGGQRKAGGNVVEACSCPNFDGFVEVFGFICPSQNLPFSTLFLPNEPSPLFEWAFLVLLSIQKYRNTQKSQQAKLADFNLFPI